MEVRSSQFKLFLTIVGLAALLLVSLVIWRSIQAMISPAAGGSEDDLTSLDLMAQLVTPGFVSPTRRPPGAPVHSPTPDLPHPLPEIRSEDERYIVQSGDTLGQIATLHGVSLEDILQVNDLENPNVLDVGQELIIPAPTPGPLGPDFKVLPDSELVYSPSSIGFEIGEFVNQQDGYLASYWEEVDDRSMSGVQIVERIAKDFSVNPRILLALLQHQSGWLTDKDPDEVKKDFPLGLSNPEYKGLYKQLTWAANNLNRGYYLWRVNGIAAWVLQDRNVVPIAPTINAATAAVQHMFAQLYGRTDWEMAVQGSGLFATYEGLFGYPFDYAIEPLLPPYLVQPPMQLPIEPGLSWAYTGGPHSAWGSGSAWGALDFAPPGETIGCVQSNDWVVAVASGLVLRAENGAVIQDLDGDGQEQTGWVVLYLHIETRDRVQPGTYLQAGERIGHPSCEGGISTGTHLHLARKYNGEWIPADQNIPFVLDGWVSVGLGFEYDGYLRRDGEQVEAYGGNSPNNLIAR